MGVALSDMRCCVSHTTVADVSRGTLADGVASPVASRYQSPRHKAPPVPAPVDTALSVAAPPQARHSRRQEARVTTPRVTMSSSPHAPPSPLDLARMAAISVSVRAMSPIVVHSSPDAARAATARPRMWQCNSLPALARGTTLTGRELVSALLAFHARTCAQNLARTAP